jgi:hypothetical protein
MLAAALHLVNVIGPHAVELAGQVRAADRDHSARADGLKAVTRVPLAEITQLLAVYERTGEPLPLMQDRHVQDRINAGWSPDDPLTPIAFSVLTRQAGFRQFRPAWLPDLRGPTEAALKAVGAERPFGRAAAWVERADGQGAVPWTLPLHREQATSLVGIVRSATVLALAAITGMRAGELMELQVGCRRPPNSTAPGWSATGWPASSSRASPSAAPATNGSSSTPPTRPPNSPSSSTTTPSTERRCSAGSTSTPATSPSATG